MNNDIIVIAHASRLQGLLPILEERLKAAGIPFALETIYDIIPNVAAANLVFNLKGWRKTIANYQGYRKIVMVDAWDMLFVGNRHDLIAAVPDHGVIVGSEKGCWPDGYLSSLIPKPTPWSCCNWGSFAGTPESFTNWFIEIEQHPQFMPFMIAQQWANQLLAQHGPSGPLRLIDYNTQLCYTMNNDKGELQFIDTGSGYHPYNTICKTYPQFIHFNHCDHSGFMMLEFAAKALERDKTDERPISTTVA